METKATLFGTKDTMEGTKDTKLDVDGLCALCALHCVLCAKKCRFSNLFILSSLSQYLCGDPSRQSPPKILIPKMLHHFQGIILMPDTNIRMFDPIKSSGFDQGIMDHVPEDQAVTHL